jgi:3-deoxy-7-phosphoheptulonate synthase
MSEMQNAGRPDDQYPLVGRGSIPVYRGNLHSRPVTIGRTEVGNGRKPLIIAGPCAVESEEQTLSIARAVKEAGADALRGGAFKPRKSPYSFQGLGEKGLEILALAREETGLPIVSEALDVRHVELVGRYVDVFQLGSRNMRNYPLLAEVGKYGMPVLLKRDMSATLDDWLCSAEYVAQEGNENIILCERGIRTFTHEEYSRFTLDLGVVHGAMEKTFLPIIVDPSHAAGKAAMVPANSRAAIAFGAHGLIVEVIGESTGRETVECDGRQGIRPSVFRELMADIDAWWISRGSARASH